MSETTLTPPSVSLPPTQADLPYDDDIPMESQRHKLQMDLLIDALLPWLAQREDGYVGGNMFVYFSMAQLKNQDFRGPDFFAVLGVPQGERRSWVVWEEGKGPDVVIELLSESTATADKNQKKLIYQNQMRVPEYFWFDPFNPDDWAGFSLQQGLYQPIAPKSQSQLISEALGLSLLRWEGSYKGVDATWLRWGTLAAELLPTAEEIAQAERLRAQAERLRAQRAESQLQQTARNLLESGMTVEQVARLTSLSILEIEALGQDSNLTS
ncbi:MAG: Uma2 family endonuclease [Gloeotrichia echinulata IR180]